MRQRARRERSGGPGDAAHCSASSRDPLLFGLGDVEALEEEREADGVERPAVAAHQVVVAPAAADHVAERGVVDLQDRARVVADVAKQAEVEVDDGRRCRARSTAS